MSRVLILPLLLLAACSGTLQEEQQQPAPSEPTSQPGTTESTPSPAAPATSGVTSEQAQYPGGTPSAASSARINRRVDVPDDITFPRYIPADGILPIYDPQFVSAEEAPLEEDELVLAISIEGQAKAYPITVLRGREMVNDELAGIPILATW